MADERYKSVSTFALPDAYQQQAAEARRRRRMAEMLAQQAYQPSDISAPIPAAAPLVQGLQAFLTARAGRKADEAEESAMKAQTREARDFLRALTEPEKKMDVGQVALQDIAQMGTPELVDGRLEYRKTAMFAPTPEMIPQAGPQVRLGRRPEDDQIYMPTATGRETDPQRIAAMLANPQFKSNFTDEQRRGLALEGMLTSENPLLQKVAGAIYPTLQPEKAKLQTAAVNLKDLTPASARRFAVSGDPQDIEYAVESGKAPPTVGGMMWDAKQGKFVEIPGYAAQQGVIADRKRPDVVIKPTDERLVRGQQFSNENALRDEYTAQTANFRVINDAYKKIMTTADTGAGDMSLLYQYVKLLDPGSVVRESEFATAAASGSFGDQVQGAAQRIATGKRLTPELKAQFRNEAQNIFDQQQSSANQTAEQYRRLATDYGLDPTRVVPGSAKSYATEAEAEAAFKSGKLKKGDRVVVNGVSGVWE
jgi:hypothetical protein